MSFEEKLTWVNTLTTVVVAAVYAWIVGVQIATTPVSEIAYQRPMLISVGAIVVLTIVGVTHSFYGVECASDKCSTA